jgi:hypothetical protein
MPSVPAPGGGAVWIGWAARSNPAPLARRPPRSSPGAEGAPLGEQGALESRTGPSYRELLLDTTACERPASCLATGSNSDNDLCTEDILPKSRLLTFKIISPCPAENRKSALRPGDEHKLLNDLFETFYGGSMTSSYIHGYDPRENLRLQDQACTLVELLHSDTAWLIADWRETNLPEGFLTHLSLLEKPGIAIFKGSESYVQNYALRGRVLPALAPQRVSIIRTGFQ